MDDQWPIPYLEQEIWLRTRRVLVNKFLSQGRWPSTSDFRAYMHSQKELGEQVKTKLLAGLLGDLDYAHLNSETIFGPANYRFRERLPYMAAFGFQLSKILHNMFSRTDNGLETVAEPCSLFNIGVSILDYILDSDPKKAAKWRALLDEKLLLELTGNEGAIVSFHDSVSKENDVEVRVLGKIVAEFFGSLASFKMDNPILVGDISICLADLYAAELASLDRKRANDPNLVDFVKLDKVFPFRVILHVTQLSPASKFRDARTMVPLGTAIGEIFWNLDEMVDVLQDLGQVRPNYILTGLSRESSLNVSREPEFLNQFLQRNCIDAAVDSLCDKLTNVARECDRLGFSVGEQQELQKFLVMYIRDWIR